VIDTRTLVLALSIGNLVLGGLLIVFAHGAMAPSGRLWTGAKLAQGFGFLLLGLRGAVPDLISISLGDAVLLLGFALEFGASWEFLRLDIWRRYFPYLLGGSLALFLACYVTGVGFGVRSIVVSGMIAGFLAATAAGYFLRWRVVSRLGRTIGIADVVVALGGIARTIWMLFRPEETLLANVPPHAMIFVTLYLFMFINGFGFLLMSKESADRELTRLATLDSLTEALNRRAFFAQAEAALALARRHRQPFSVMMLDLDRFKLINDAYGHPAGDEVIRQLVRNCRGQVRESDLIGRMGGEEFALALPGTPLEGAVAVAERIRMVTRETPARTPAGIEIRFAVSIGVTQAGKGEPMDPILARADRALYESKTQGRDRVTAATPEGMG
jgi:diguanylate cyclase (GGDEF)-like protein